jgi:hypothetical protein
LFFVLVLGFFVHVYGIYGFYDYFLYFGLWFIVFVWFLICFWSNERSGAIIETLVGGTLRL